MRQREARISDAIRKAIEPMQGVKLWRNSPALARVRGGRAWCGLPRGSADLVGIVEVKIEAVKIGRFFALEVKAPGETPTPEDIGRILDKIGIIGTRLHGAPVWERLISKLPEAERHVIQQEAWLEGVRQIGGFAAYVDCPEAAVRAVELARDPACSLARWRVITAETEHAINFTT